MKALLVDDHPLFLEGLRSLVSSQGLTVVGTARDGIEALEQARELLPDVMLMDIQMPNCDGLTATRLIKNEFPDIKIIILSVYDSEEFIIEAIKNGATGFFLKNLDIEEFNWLLKNLEKDELIIVPSLISKLLNKFTSQERKSATPFIGNILKDLTERQLEILAMAADGLTYKEIGAKLFLTERTVKYHMKQILAKLQLNNRKQAVNYLKSIQKLLKTEVLMGSSL